MSPPRYRVSLSLCERGTEQGNAGFSIERKAGGASQREREAAFDGPRFLNFEFEWTEKEEIDWPWAVPPFSDAWEYETQHFFKIVQSHILYQ
jgi:hypothetical protein